MTETRWHRFRHYPGKWSTFDQIEKCERPGKFCCGCEFEHPFCSEMGRVEESPQEGETPKPGAQK